MMLHGRHRMMSDRLWQKFVIGFAVLFVLLQSCSGNGGDVSPQDDESVFLQHGSPCMVIGRGPILDTDASEDAQSSFNEDKLIFRVATGISENGAPGEYFILILDSLPSRDKTAKGSLVVRTASRDNTYSADFTLLKRESGLMWLWAPSMELGVVVSCR